MNKKLDKFKKLSKVIKAMSHPTRLLIIDALAKKEKCVCEINELIDVDQSTVSKHLSVLKNANIIYDEKHGLNVYYFLKQPCVINYINCLEKTLKDNE